MNKKIINACKNQHIVPQFLQRNFSSNNKLFRHTKNKSFIVNITNNFSENEYYSERPYENSTELTLDQQITKKESDEHGPHLNYLLSLEIDKEFNMTEATSNFIYHFIFRNKKTIKSLVESLEYRFSQICSTENTVKEKIFERIKFKLIPEFRINQFNCNWEIIKKEFYNSYDSVISQAFDYWFENKIENLRKIHNICISDNKYLINFKFKILEGFFILPNTVLIAYNSKQTINYLPYVDCETEYILFPISSKKVLIIYKDIFPILDINLINEYLVSGSDEFCSELDEKNPLIIKLKQHLNINKINDLLNEDIEQVVKDNIKNNAETYAKEILKKARTKKGWRKIK